MLTSSLYGSRSSLTTMHAAVRVDVAKVMNSNCRAIIEY